METTEAAYLRYSRIVLSILAIITALVVAVIGAINAIGAATGQMEDAVSHMAFCTGMLLCAAGFTLAAGPPAELSRTMGGFSVLIGIVMFQAIRYPSLFGMGLIVCFPMFLGVNGITLARTRNRHVAPQRT